MKYIKTLNNYIKENYLPSDAIGYNIGEFVYHITPKKNLNTIKKNGFIPKDGISINNKPFKNRLYFATSLIAAYDLSVNFNSYRDNDEYVIFKLDSKCIDKGYEEDELFIHGIYVDYKIPYSFVVDIINASDLFNKFDDDDFDRLYENKQSKKWFRGYTSNTNNTEYIWITSDYNHAKQYSEINKLIYSGDSIIDEITILNNPNLLDLNSYDMDEKMDMDDIECFLEDYNISYDYEDLFDISENMIPFSRLVNNIIGELIMGYDGFKILEDGIETIYINKKYTN